MSATYSIRRGTMVAMRDGVALATDVYLPNGEGPFPTLLHRTPYDRADAFGTQYVAQMSTLRALDSGFAVVVQDTRGRFGSAGAFVPFVHERHDGADTVEWIRNQDFSDGEVASYGGSYVGATQMLLAAEGVEGHVAMAPFLTTGDYHDGWTYRGGALQLGFVYLWIIESLGPVDVEHRELSADHPARATLAALLEDPQGSMERLPVLAEDLVDLAPYLASWLSNPTPDPWWSTFAPLAQVERMQTPALHIAGFNDIFLEGSIRSYELLRHTGSSSEVRGGQYLVIGPWSHGNIGDWQGERWLGYHAAAPALDLVGMQLDFFRAVLEGRDPSLPRVRYFTSGVNAWRSAAEWPPPSDTTSFYLGADGGLSAQAGHAGVDCYVCDPLDPVPTAGGASFLPGILVNRNDGPQPQAAVEARADVLVYRTRALDESVEVTGRVTVELWAESSATDCDWTARLVDVDEAGRAVGIVDGILRSRYRHGAEATPLTPGKAERFLVELGNTSHVFAAGHRIGLQIASSNFPRFDRNPQQMVDPVRASPGDFVVAEQTVHTGADLASRLILPVVR